jgi:DNA repair photolyase
MAIGQMFALTWMWNAGDIMISNLVDDRRSKVGHSTIEYKQAKSILTESSGFISTYDYTLNPYSGCTFGCNYCYAAFFAKTEELKGNWGKWVQIKENALALLVKWRSKSLDGKTIYMSSVTDPYQPVEKDLALTRSILSELLQHHKARLVVQTRGPLVTRDIDLFKQFDFVQVNMTVTTDDDAIRRKFEPTCPSIGQRLNAIKQVRDAGIQTCVTMTPLLPVSSPERFAEKLIETGAHQFVIQDFHDGNIRFAAGTGKQALEVSQEMRWGKERYEEVRDYLREHLPNLREGQEGFRPPWKVAQLL